MGEGGRKPDWVGRGIGLAVFALGIVLLIIVFIWSNGLMRLAPQAGQKVTWEWATTFGIGVARLFVMGLIASWIAGRGAQLYAAANRALSGD